MQGGQRVDVMKRKRAVHDSTIKLVHEHQSKTKSNSEKVRSYYSKLDLD
jgi:hypothetical protein